MWLGTLVLEQLTEHLNVLSGMAATVLASAATGIAALENQLRAATATISLENAITALEICNKSEPAAREAAMLGPGAWQTCTIQLASAHSWHRCAVLSINPTHSLAMSFKVYLEKAVAEPAILTRAAESASHGTASSSEEEDTEEDDDDNDSDESESGGASCSTSGSTKGGAAAPSKRTMKTKPARVPGALARAAARYRPAAAAAAAAPKPAAPGPASRSTRRAVPKSK